MGFGSGYTSTESILACKANGNSTKKDVFKDYTPYSEKTFESSLRCGRSILQRKSRHFRVVGSQLIEWPEEFEHAFFMRFSKVALLVPQLDQKRTPVLSFCRVDIQNIHVKPHSNGKLTFLLALVVPAQDCKELAIIFAKNHISND